MVSEVQPAGAPVAHMEPTVMIYDTPPSEQQTKGAAMAEKQSSRSRSRIGQSKRGGSVVSIKRKSDDDMHLNRQNTSRKRFKNQQPMANTATNATAKVSGGPTASEQDSSDNEANESVLRRFGIPTTSNVNNRGEAANPLSPLPKDDPQDDLYEISGDEQVNEASEAVNRIHVSRGHDERPQSRTELKPNIIYSISVLRDSKLRQEHWPEGSLDGKSVDVIFREVTDIIGRSVKRIDFRLSTSRKEKIYKILPEDSVTYNIMKTTFGNEIRGDFSHGEKHFEIDLQPEPVQALPTRKDSPGFSFA